MSTPVSLFNLFSHVDAGKARNILQRLGIADKEKERADKLSGGEQQRVGLARALMQEPKLILADEPISSLDPATSKQIMDLLKEFNQQDGVTVICNLHLPSLSREYGSRIIALNQGCVVYDGPVNNLSDTEPVSYTHLTLPTIYSV